jgi:hypothetical protein
MEMQTAHQIIDTLAQGIHPVTGGAMPEDSPYNAPPVIRALFAVSQALQDRPAKVDKPRRELPPKAGKPWDAEEDAWLASAFDVVKDFKQLAGDLGRTPFAVESRLVKLGKLPARAGRFGPPAA